MKRSGIAALGMLAFAIAAPAQAQRISRVDATGVLGQCEVTPAPLCEAYLVGFTDAEGTNLPRRFCVPAATTPDQLRSAVIKFLRTNRADLNDSGAKQVAKALAHAYPCSK